MTQGNMKQFVVLRLDGATFEMLDSMLTPVYASVIAQRA